MNDFYSNSFKPATRQMFFQVQNPDFVKKESVKENNINKIDKLIFNRRLLKKKEQKQEIIQGFS